MASEVSTRGLSSCMVEPLFGQVFAPGGGETLVIAHRLFTVKGIDRIIAPAQGHVVEKVLPDARPPKVGLSAQLHQAQLRD